MSLSSTSPEAPELAQVTLLIKVILLLLLSHYVVAISPFTFGVFKLLTTAGVIGAIVRKCTE